MLQGLFPGWDELVSTSQHSGCCCGSKCAEIIQKVGCNFALALGKVSPSARHLILHIMAFPVLLLNSTATSWPGSAGSCDTPVWAWAVCSTLCVNWLDSLLLPCYLVIAKLSAAYFEWRAYGEVSL